MARNPNKPKRFAQIREAYTITREQDKRIGFILAALDRKSTRLNSSHT